MAGGGTEPMARRHPILRTFLILALGVFGLMALGAVVVVFGGFGERPFLGKTVGVVDVRGVIEDAGDTVAALRHLSADERALLQGMVDDVRGQFVDAVARGRGMPPARVRALADGRIYSGSQALSQGLVDRLGGLDAATRLAWEDAHETGEPRVERVRTR